MLTGTRQTTRRTNSGVQMGANPDVRIHVYQMVLVGRLNYTVGVSIPKKYLG